MADRPPPGVKTWSKRGAEPARKREPQHEGRSCLSGSLARISATPAPTATTPATPRSSGTLPRPSWSTVDPGPCEIRTMVPGRRGLQGHDDLGGLVLDACSPAAPTTTDHDMLAPFAPIASP